MNCSPPLTILIADDETPARNRLRELLSKIDNIEILGEAKNGKEVLTLFEETQAKVLLLDIRMPQIDGIEAAMHLQKIGSPPPVIIFTTAFDGYAVQAFEINAVDYLLKPIRLERLQSALVKARALIPSQLEAIKVLRPTRSHFSVNERGRFILVPLIDVIYLRAELKYTTIRTKEREYLIDDSLTSIEQEFGSQFLRLHRNCLVAVTSILGYEKKFNDEGEYHWEVILKDIPETLSVSRRQFHLLKELKI